jgi:hypothetical protein
MIDQKQLEIVESFKYLGSILTNYGRYMCEIKSRTAMAKAAFNKKRTLFTSSVAYSGLRTFRIKKCAGSNWTVNLFTEQMKHFATTCKIAS